MCVQRLNFCLSDAFILDINSISDKISLNIFWNYHLEKAILVKT